MVGAGDILGLVPASRHTVTTNGPDRHLLELVAGDPLCPSKFPSVLELLLVTVGADLLVLGVVLRLEHVGDGEIIWGLGGLDIGVVDLLM